MDKNIIKWNKAPVSSGKKYEVILKDGTKVRFGALNFSQYRDDTPLKLYSKDNHLDKARRDRYYARHNTDYPKYSADWFSKFYLWRKD